MRQEFRFFPRSAILFLLLSPLSGQSLVLAPAVEVSVPTEPGRLYRLEHSTGLETWAPWGSWVVGDGSAWQSVAPLASEGRYFRVVEAPVADLNTLLENQRVSTGLPALAAVVIQDGVVRAVGAVGQRRHGTVAPVSLTDEWHHGSITKSMTASLAAVLVEEGVIAWETTLGEVFPGKVPAMASGWADVTLKQLLANSGGAPGDLSTNGIWTTLWNFQGLPAAGRELLLEEVTALPLRFTPGAGYEYSNAGFAIAGRMLEARAGMDWEALITERLFRPLAMESAGFGVPATPRHLDHPVGHAGTVSSPSIWDPGTSADNPPAIGPAGTVHASILDLARYVQWHLAGARGEAVPLLPPAAFETLHSRAFGNQYALGWNVLNRSWAGGDALQHTGSNTQWYTNIWIAPEVNWAVVVCTNFGGTQAFAKTDQVILALIGAYGP
jgi:CubicO group peptidase (beta-lactamase class C family)